MYMLGWYMTYTCVLNIYVLMWYQASYTGHGLCQMHMQVRAHQSILATSQCKYFGTQVYSDEALWEQLSPYFDFSITLCARVTILPVSFSTTFWLQSIQTYVWSWANLI